MSRPPRARGLKRDVICDTSLIGKSRPPRARGLKLASPIDLVVALVVAPPAGAWIETRRLQSRVAVNLRVAPPAGAWIETSFSLVLSLPLMMGRAPRGRVD